MGSLNVTDDTYKCRVLQTATKMAEGERRNSVRQSVPKIRKTLKSISEEITDEELSKLIFLARDELPKGQTQNMNCLKLLAALEERQLIDTKNEDLCYLLDLLDHLPRLDLFKKLKSSLSVGSNCCTQHNVPVTHHRHTKIIHEALQSSSVSDSTTVSNSITEATFESNVTSVKHDIADDRNGGFLQEPDLLNSTFQNYNDTIAELETVTVERDNALKACQMLEKSKMELEKKVNSLEREVEAARDDQNNMICERNNALAAKSEYVFKESEAKKELSDMKRTKNLLEKSLAKANHEVEKQEEGIKELTKQLKESQEEVEDLKVKLDEVTLHEAAVVKELQKVEDKAREGDGKIKCNRCGLIYVEANNPTDACRYHSGKYDLSGLVMKKMEWSCCRHTNKNSPGCCKNKHLSIDHQFSPGPESKSFKIEKSNGK